jgi:hypothetical protein
VPAYALSAPAVTRLRAVSPRGSELPGGMLCPQLGSLSSADSLDQLEILKLQGTPKAREIARLEVESNAEPGK